MQDSYYLPIDDTHAATADLVSIDDEHYVLTRIYVPPEFRGQGHGSALLTRVTDDADLHGIHLLLEINPYGPLNKTALRKWYTRHGFRTEPDGTMWRFPQQPKG